MTHSTTKANNAATGVIIDASVIDNTVEQGDDLLREEELGYGSGKYEWTHAADDDGVLGAAFLTLLFLILTSFSIGVDVVHHGGAFSTYSFVGIIISALTLGAIPTLYIRYTMDWNVCIMQKAIFQRNVKWVAKKAGISEEAAKSLVLYGNYIDRGTTRSYLKIDGETITLYRQLNKRSPQLKIVQEFQLDQEFHDMLKTEKAAVEDDS